MVCAKLQSLLTLTSISLLFAKKKTALVYVQPFLLRFKVISINFIFSLYILVSKYNLLVFEFYIFDLIFRGDTAAAASTARTKANRSYNRDYKIGELFHYKSI